MKRKKYTESIAMSRRHITCRIIKDNKLIYQSQIFKQNGSVYAILVVVYVQNGSVLILVALNSQ